MKKLMTLAALVAACAPAFTAEVTSSNTVGYQKIDLTPNRMQIIGCQFVGLNADGVINIQDVIPNENFDVDGEDWIRTYDPILGEYTDASFLSEDNCSVEGCAWCDNGWNPVDFDIENGQGLYIKSVHSNSKVLFAGEVATNLTVSLPVNRMTIVCNPLPIAINVQDIVPNANFDVDGEDWLRVYNPVTGQYTSAIFLSEDNCSVEGGAWCNDGWNPVDFDIAAGEGFWIKSVHQNSAITFPTPEAAAAAAAARAND